MDDKEHNNDDDERPGGESNEETPWQTGIRRRRGNNSTNNPNSAVQQQSSNDPQTHRRQNDMNNNENGGGNAAFGLGAGAAAAIGVGGPCGGVGGGVAVGHQPSAAFGTMGNNGGGFGAPSTPLKPNNSSNGKQLVPATPSSVTTAETAGSTLYTTQSPLRVHRRQNSSRRGQSRSPSLRRQYQILQSQTLLLLGGSALGLLFFLFFALPLAAFVSFALTIASIGALVPVASSAVRARYELEMEHPLGLLRYLPESLRVLLTETSIHQWMVEGTFVMEYRHLLLYLIPGIEEDQLMEFINRLPPRHRDVLLQPGLGRLIPPSAMRHFIRMDNNDATSGDNTQLPQILENDETDNVSIPSGLTHDHDDHISVINEGENDDQVTFFEAITSLRQTLRSAESFSPNQTPLSRVATPRAENVHTTPDTPPTTQNATEINVQEDDDNSSFDISIDLDMTDIIREPMTPVATPSPENIVVGITRPTPNVSNDEQGEQAQPSEQEEFEIEGRVISDAINAAVANYSSQASAVVVESASEAVDGVSTWVIRTGTLTGFLAGGGGVLAAMFSSPPTSLSIALGSMVDRITSREVTSRENESNGTNALDSQNQTFSNQLVNGLLTTSFVGFTSAGFSYLIRNSVRRAITARRQERLESSSGNEDEK